MCGYSTCKFYIKCYESKKLQRYFFYTFGIRDLYVKLVGARALPLELCLEAMPRRYTPENKNILIIKTNPKTRKK